MANPVFSMGRTNSRAGTPTYYYRPQRSWGKVIFSQASVILFTAGGVVTSPGGVWSGHGRGCGIPACLAGFQAHSQEGSLWGSEGGSTGPHPRGELRGIWPRGVETPRDGYCCGRYASYWNAFLFCEFFIEDCMEMKGLLPERAHPWCATVTFTSKSAMLNLSVRYEPLNNN